MDDRFRFSTDPSDIDRELVHRWLSEQAYWALGRPRSVQEAGIDASRNYAVMDDESASQVAYARVVTDGATFAWLCDVFVDPDVRGLGVGVGLMFLAREGLSFAMLKVMPDAAQAEVPDDENDSVGGADEPQRGFVGERSR